MKTRGSFAMSGRCISQVPPLPHHRECPPKGMCLIQFANNRLVALSVVSRLAVKLDQQTTEVSHATTFNQCLEHLIFAAFNIEL